MKMRRRLGVSPGPVAAKGPEIVSDWMCGSPVQSSVSAELRRNGCSRRVSSSAEIANEGDADVAAARP